MSDADAIEFILNDAKRRRVPDVLSVEGRAVAVAMAPDFEFEPVFEPQPTAAEMLASAAGNARQTAINPGRNTLGAATAVFLGYFTWVYAAQLTRRRAANPMRGRQVECYLAAG